MHKTLITGFLLIFICIHGWTAHPTIRFFLKNHSNGQKDETVLYFHKEATNGFDGSYDAFKLDNSGKLNFYSYSQPSNEKKLSINGLGLAALSGEITINFGYSLKDTGSYALLMSEITNISKQVKVLLFDSNKKKYINIRQDSSYSFSAGNLSNNDRFRLVVSSLGHQNVFSPVRDHDWHNGENWTDSIPALLSHVVVKTKDSINITEKAECYDLTMDSGAVVVIESQGSLTVHGNIVLHSPENSGIPATIIDRGKLTVYGTSSMERYLTANRWWYISSPFENALTTALSPSDTSSRCYEWNETLPDWAEVTQDSLQMVPFKGYAYKPARDSIYRFSGKLQSGEVSFPLSASGNDDYFRWNLVGNPYPSAVDWNSRSGINKDHIYSSIYFQEKNGICTYVDGVSVNCKEEFNGYIAPFQGFWVFASNDNINNPGKLEINNNARTWQWPVNMSLKDSNHDGTIKITLQREEKHANATAIRIKSGATYRFDEALDALLFHNTLINADSSPVVYSLSEDNKKLDINTLPNILNTIRLGVKLDKPGQYTMKIKNHLPPRMTSHGGQHLVITDKKSNESYELQNGETTLHFYGEEGITNDRFIINMKKNTSVSGRMDHSPSFIRSRHTLILKLGEDSQGGKLSIYDMRGRIVREKYFHHHQEAYISLDDLPKGIYLVKYAGKNNALSSKIIINE